MNKVTVDLGESEIPWVLGKGWANHDVSQYHCTNVTIKVKSLQCLAKESGEAATMLANDAVTGITVIESSKTAG